MAAIENGSTTAEATVVDQGGTDGALLITTPGYTASGVILSGGPAAGPAVFYELDPGEASGARLVRSPEVDGDFRIRQAHDTILDWETFNYTAQNTGKHSHAFTTLTATVSAAGLLLNSGSGIATSTGMTFGTQAQFPVGMGVTHVYAETSAAFSATAPPANVVVDIGMFHRGATTAFAPLDGAFFRFTSAGMVGVISRSGVETQSGVFNWTPVANQNYLLTVSITEKRVRFWIDDVNMGVVENVGSGQPFTSATLPWSVRQANVGAAGGVFQTLVTDYTISLGGPVFADTLGVTGNRTLGSYQGLSGGTMGSLANYANSANPTAAVPTNTTAALGVGLGGQFWETDTLAVTTDGIIDSYQVPAGTIAVQGRKLRLNGVSIASYVQTALTGGGYVAQWSLAFGHTAVALNTTESASFANGTAKAPRRVAIPGVQSVPSAAAALTVLQTVTLTLANPIFVNPGGFVAVVKKKVGSAPSAGVIAHVVTFDYSWE